MRWKWANVPVPLEHLLGLILGAIMQSIFKQALFDAPLIRIAIALPLIAVGVGLSVRSVLEAGETKIEAPAKLLTNGPYSLSRDPMYVAWTLMYLGIALVANSLWITVLLPIVVALTHFVDVAREESYLEKRFGKEYLQYERRARRYL